MVVSLNRINKSLTQYDTLDSSLVSSRDYIRQFGLEEDYVEYHVYTVGGSLLFSKINYTDYKVPGNLQGDTNTYTEELQLFPEVVVQQLGFTYGTFIVQFNILRKKIVNLNDPVFFIKEISSDRTEIRVSTNVISNFSIEEGVVNFLYEIQTSAYFKDFLLNFGNNKFVNAVNIALDKNTDPYSILIKLYRPLPDEFGLKSSFWVVEELSEAIVYEAEIAPEPIKEVVPTLRPPNFDIDVDFNYIKPSEYLNTDSLLSNQSITAYRELLNIVNKKGIYIKKGF